MAVVRRSIRQLPMPSSRLPTPSRCRPNVRLHLPSDTQPPAQVETLTLFVPMIIVLEAGKAFEKAADIQTNNLKEPDDAANTLTDAFKAYRTVDPPAAARCLNIAIDRYCAKGNFRRAASQKEQLAAHYEETMGDVKKALEAYEAAAGWYEGDNANA